MLLPSTLQGRPFGAGQLAEIEHLLEQSPESSRYQLSRRLATLWNWRTASGQLKDMAARTLLLKLQEQGWIKLPERRWASPTRSGRAPAETALALLDETRFEGSLCSLLPLRIEEVSQLGRHVRRAQLEACVARYHYLGYRSRVGQNLQYWIGSAEGRPLACVIFGAAAWQCAARDQWIGWSKEQRAQRLSGVVNNTRFLIFNWICVPHLASHILGSIRQRIAADWKAKYRQALFVLETFVDRERFTGGCYRAADWLCVGQTRGRGRQGPHDPSTSIKDVYVYPLDPHFRQHLNHSHPSPC
jgi:TM2 domain-containing membrane protein YozV